MSSGSVICDGAIDKRLVDGNVWPVRAGHIGYSVFGTIKASGAVISGVTMTLSGASTKTVITDAYGNYTFTGLSNGSYTITPDKAGYIFTPVNRTLTINNVNVPGQNFAGTTLSKIYSPASLVGTWNGHSLANGPSAPFWQTVSIDIATDGSFTGAMVQSDGQSGPVSGTMIISTDGIVSMTGKPDLHCSMDAGKTMLVCTDQWNDGSGLLRIFIKKPAVCKQADLIGNWVSNGLQSGAKAPWWGRGTWSIDKNGTQTGTMYFSDNTSENVTATLKISNDCVITPSDCVGCGDNGMRCSLDSDKTVMACTGTVPNGNSELVLMTKKTNSYSIADLAGTWGIHNLATNGSGKDWSEYGSISMLPNGSYTGSLQHSDGSHPEPISGSFKINAAGNVTGFSDVAFQCDMDSGKTVIACAETQTDGSSEMPVFTKQMTNTPPILGTLTPAVLTRGPNIAQTFTAVYSDPNGYADIKQVYFRVHTAANGIYVRYDRAANKLYLFDDAGTAVVAGGGCVPGTAGTITNKQGSLNCTATKVTGSGKNLTINLNLTPSAAFASATKKNLYMFVRDMSNATAGWTDMGDWTITSTNTAPTVSLTTASPVISSALSPVTITAAYTDTDGYANLKYAELLAAAATTGANSVWTRYDVALNRLYIFNDAGTGLQAGFCLPGEAKTLGNTQGTLNCGATTVGKSGNTVTVNWNITPAAGYTGTKNIKLKATDQSLLTTGLIKKGTWKINP